MDERIYMQRCLELAQRAKGHTAPNPMVGAVLVHDGRIIGEGWHHYYGADHAEVNCLANVAAEDKKLIPGSTMYVSLEPCAHQGITPPCASRLVKERVKKVVIANIDPFEQVSGRGMAILEDGGIAAESGLLADEGAWANRRFFCFHKRKRPYIVLKWAQTANRFIAPEDGSRLQITGNESQQLVHKWRTEETAIMVGYNTALHDNPRLTARLWAGKQPLRIVLDKNLKLPATHHIFDNEAATWIINEERETLHGNVHSVQLKFDDTLLTHILHRLYDAKVQSIIIEGGARLLHSFISEGLWDEARVFSGPDTIAEGLAAPLLTNASAAFKTGVGSDHLQVFINQNSAYPYVQGMPL